MPRGASRRVPLYKMSENGPKIDGNLIGILKKKREHSALFFERFRESIQGRTAGRVQKNGTVAGSARSAF